MVDFNKIEEKWQKKWNDTKIFNVEVEDYDKPKYFITTPYPYMSGLLHLGHLFTYNTPEILLRYKRMKGFNVLQKFGFHCTGTPIVAAAKRVEEGEEKQIQTLKKMGIAEKEIPKFADPIHWIEYFPKETLKDLKKMGFAIDERYSFRTTDINPPYDAFIRWQFNKLYEKEYVKKGKHPVVWCPKCNEPTGDHARSEGEGETPQQFLLFKHKLDDGRFLISATLRSDTVLGITNLYIGPDIEYVEADVDGEKWILGEPATKRLKEQGFKVEIKKKVKGVEFIGKEVIEFGDIKVPVLPATFLNPEFGTGLVHSVPSDSADDLIALWDLQKDEETCKKYGLEIERVRKVKPIAILNTPEYGDIAAEAILKKYGIKSQNERDKLEKIKKELYKLSHYSATLNGKYNGVFGVDLEGKKVEEAKSIITSELIEQGYAVKYFELTGKVVCRCLTECVVKVVTDQWFIEYNNPEWKQLAHKALNNMTIYPEKIEKQFNYVIDWLDKWACTRETGLGTKLPWDRKWMIESLSDSTMQMAYCTISKYLQHPEEYGFSTDKLNDDFFDYVILGKGDVKKVSESTGIDTKMIEKMRKDYDYWYPFDFRNSAKDLIQNHLTFCMFNHTAVLPEDKWPKAFLINGRIMVNNEKMSKSKGNFFTMRELYEKHGADIVRLTAANAGEGAEDANYDMNFLETGKRKLNDLFEFINENYNKGREDSAGIDEWFESKINECVRDSTEAMDNMLFKSAVQCSFLDMQRHLKWYMKRCNENPNKKLINMFIESMIKMMAPFTPHFCEECWEAIGKEDFVSAAGWPEYDESKINPELDITEQFIGGIYTDIRKVKELAKIDKIKTVKIIISPEWKYDFFEIVKRKIEETRDAKLLIGEVMKTDLKKHGQDVMKLIPAVIKDPSKIPMAILGQGEEVKVVNSEVDKIGSEFECAVVVENAESSSEAKAKQASPLKPAIVLE